MFQIQHRKRILVNTDPQRRCYNGCHFSSEWRWTEWTNMETWPDTVDAAARLEFWRGLNKIAVDGRGEGAMSEYKVVTEECNFLSI